MVDYEVPQGASGKMLPGLMGGPHVLMRTSGMSYGSGSICWPFGGREPVVGLPLTRT